MRIFNDHKVLMLVPGSETNMPGIPDPRAYAKMSSDISQT